MIALHHPSREQKIQPSKARLGHDLTRLVLVGATLLGVVATPVNADQEAPELPGLFSQLQAETDSAAAKSIEEKIWQHWIVAP